MVIGDIAEDGAACFHVHTSLALQAFLEPGPDAESINTALPGIETLVRMWVFSGA